MDDDAGWPQEIIEVRFAPGATLWEARPLFRVLPGTVLLGHSAPRLLFDGTVLIEFLVEYRGDSPPAAEPGCKHRR